MMRWSTRFGREHRRPTAVSAMRYALGTALIVAVLVGGAAPALAGAQVTATCDRWDVTLSDYKAGSTVSIWLDGVLAIDEYVFQDGFSLGGAWQKYADTHLLGVRIDLNGVLQHGLNHGATGCPTSAPPTTAPAPPTTAPAPPTTAPPTTQPTPATTVAETPETTTAAPTLSTTTTLATTALAPSTTVDADTAETGPSDTTVVAAVEAEPPSGSNAASLLIGLLAGLVLAGVGGGAWYFGRRSTQN